MFALIDCNNFFVSCERVFAPQWNHKPVIVLSRNDGCIIARSNEIKKIGIPMGAPLFKWRDLIQKKGVKLFSCNFRLYGDLSKRVMKTLKRFTEHLEIYSIDEAFLKIPEMNSNKLNTYAQEIIETIKKETGIPVSIGIAPTKTLCKIAVSYAKKKKETQSEILFTDHRNFEDRLKNIPIEEVWGIGRSMAPKMYLKGIFTALDLKNAEERLIRQDFKVFGARLLQELRGNSCFTEREKEKIKKSICYTRSFSNSISTLIEIEKVIAQFAAEATKKLRKEKAVAQIINVSLATSRHDNNAFKKSFSVYLDHPTAFTPEIIKVAKEGVKNIFQVHYKIKRVGVTLMGIYPDYFMQPDLFNEYNSGKEEIKKELMKKVDLLNRKFGKNSVRYLAEGIQSAAKINCTYESPAYTTSWKDLLVIKI